MSTIIVRVQSDVCAAILVDELNDEYSGVPFIENIRIDDGVNLSISYDIAPNAAQLIQLDDVLAAHDCSELDGGDTASDTLFGDVANTSGATITFGMPVYLTGFDETTQLSTVAMADASDPTKMPAFGVVVDDILDGNTGHIITSGQIINIDTSNFIIGQEVYVKSGGGFTVDKPTGTDLIQKMGEIQVVDSIVGRAQIFGAGRTNDVPNLSPNTVWMGDNNHIPKETDIYTESEIDAFLLEKSDTQHTHVPDDIIGLPASGGIFHASFLNESTTKNRWLEYAEDRSCSEVPFIVPWNSRLIGITFINKESNRDTDVRIYRANQSQGRSDTLIHTWSVRDARTARKTIFASDIEFAAGDKVAVYLKDAGSDPKAPMIVLYFERIDELTSDFSEDYSGNF